MGIDACGDGTLAYELESGELCGSELDVDISESECLRLRVMVDFVMRFRGYDDLTDRDGE